MQCGQGSPSLQASCLLKLASVERPSWSYFLYHGYDDIIRSSPSPPTLIVSNTVHRWLNYFISWILYSTVCVCLVFIFDYLGKIKNNIALKVFIQVNREVYLHFYLPVEECTIPCKNRQHQQSLWTAYLVTVTRNWSLFITKLSLSWKDGTEIRHTSLDWMKIKLIKGYNS